MIEININVNFFQVLFSLIIIIKLSTMLTKYLSSLLKKTDLLSLILNSLILKIMKKLLIKQS